MPKCLLFIIILLLAGGYVSALDSSVGVCTRQAEFSQKQDETDKIVQQYVAEKSEIGRQTRLQELAGLADKYIENLIRYRQKELAPVFAAILKNPKWFIRTRALYALKMVGGKNEIPAVVKLLSDKEPMVREAAANCLSNIGNDTAVKALEKQRSSENDQYVKSSIESARAVLKAPPKPYVNYKDGSEYSEKLAGPENARWVEYAWTVKGAPLFNDYFAGYPEMPETKSWRYPVSWYKDDLFAGYPRNSFGGTHAGEDHAWFREGCSLYAIADGIVRLVQGAGGDWGFLIVLEHRLPDGSYLVSLYGHCAWDVLVKSGEQVKAGQKIGTQGLSCSLENGGYGSHVHFGIGDGPFRRSQKYSKGNSIELEQKGKQVSGTIMRLGYSKNKKNSYGFPLVNVVVKCADKSEVEISLPAEELQAEVSWMQAYVKDCVGWLNPQTFLPEHVEAKKK